MTSYIDAIENSEIETYKTVEEAAVEAAEQQLDMPLPPKYRNIVKAFGVLEIGSDEIFGLGVEGYLNVCETTLQERKLTEGKLDNYIVIQNLGIGILIVIDAQDEVYEYQSGKLKALQMKTDEYILQLA
ncbi:hypothetical protein CH76_09945 [Lysinibacillus sp. BF-4]|uniref:SMI1/KNR4 family protein n=1 Tax=Lysinibacillus sp. BF-4 TaxID=1473546 RepID=UPI0005003BAF|nr:SMI1/KNR4 family protein [Lysinibacillus sp. BF-4]KFL42877.1 hypothetical protein CH76_09945 [Lysinibacillus sp. BF-4]